MGGEYEVSDSAVLAVGVVETEVKPKNPRTQTHPDPPTIVYMATFRLFETLIMIFVPNPGYRPGGSTEIRKC